MRLPSGVGGPTTQEAGYFKREQEVFVPWLRDGLGDGWDTVAPGWNSLEDAVIDLKPTGILNRYACIGIDSWTLVLNNGPMGTDVGMFPSYAARELGCRAVRAVCTSAEAKYPARILEVFGADGQPPLMLERSIVAANDGGRWVFEVSGQPFEFEDLNAYQQRMKSKRFTSDMIHSYLAHLGVPVDSEPDWFGAVLLTHRIGE